MHEKLLALARAASFPNGARLISHARLTHGSEAPELEKALHGQIVGAENV